MKTENDFLDYLKEIERSAAELGFESLDETFTEHLRCRFFGQDVIAGRTERVLLREICFSDLDAFYGFSDAGSEPVLNAFLKESREESEAFLQSYIGTMYPLYDCGIWTVQKASGGEIIGLCGLGKNTVSGEECTDLGYYICPEYRGQGYASECIGIALRYAEHYLELPCLYAVFGRDNAISKKLLKKFGFADTGKTAENGDFVYRKEFQN